MNKLLFPLALLLLAGCAEVPYQGYAGAPKPETDVATVRLWTPTTTNVFSSPGLIMRQIDGLPAGDVGRASHAYLLPGEHEFEVGFIQVKAYNLLCGALCDSIFNKPRTFRAKVEAGKTYLLKYVNDDQGTVVLEDKGANYDKTCLKAREYSKDRC
jgi:hypothetical protein